MKVLIALHIKASDLREEVTILAVAEVSMSWVPHIGTQMTAFHRKIGVVTGIECPIPLTSDGAIVVNVYGEMPANAMKEFSYLLRGSNDWQVKHVSLRLED